MEVNRILYADVLDIIFEGRNKDYGAYELRKTYHKRVSLSIFIMVALCAGIFVTSIFANHKNEDIEAVVYVKDITLDQVEEKK